MPAPRLNRPVQRGVEFGPGDTGGIIRTAQVTGFFDLSPSSLPGREVHEGPPQVHRRSARGQRIPARRRPARRRFIGGQSLHSAGHAQASRARPAARRGSAKRRHAPCDTVPPRPRRYPDISRSLATARGFLEPCRATTSDHQGSSGCLAGSSPKTVGHQNPGASGSVNRWLRPDSVRHMSVTTAMQGLTAAHHETRRDNSKAAREPGYAQATGRFRRWWQVLGSNQRGLSRRFYRPFVLIGPYSP